MTKKDDVEDRVLALEPLAPGKVTAGVRVAADGTARTVGITPLKEGQPLMGTEEMGISDGAGGWRVVRATSKGPAQVATEEYRENYDRIFGTKAPVGEA